MFPLETFHLLHLVVNIGPLLADQVRHLSHQTGDLLFAEGLYIAVFDQPLQFSSCLLFLVNKQVLQGFLSLPLTFCLLQLFVEFGDGVLLIMRVGLLLRQCLLQLINLLFKGMTPQQEAVLRYKGLCLEVLWKTLEFFMCCIVFAR